MKTSKKNSRIVIIDSLVKDQQFVVKHNEKKTLVIFLANGKSQTGEVRVIINGTSAKVNILGIILGSGEQKIELHSVQDHRRRESISDLLVKTVLFDKAKFYYQGLIKIAQEAQKSNAYQKNQNLLMSNQSWAESKPYLEIIANDVRCTHGATIGRIDQNQLYYLQSRGLAKIQAEKMLVEGYFEDVLERISDTDIQRKIRQELSYKLNKLI